MASESLIWHLIRDNNSFLVKRGQTKRDGSIQLSKEPGNLMNVNSFKYSGLANHKTIDLQTTNPNFGKKEKVPFPEATSMVVMQKKNFKKAASAPANSNAKSVTKIPLNKHIKKGLASVKALVGSGLSGKGKKVTYAYRPDLASVAALRFKKLHNVALIRNGKLKSARAATKRESKRA